MFELVDSLCSLAVARWHRCHRGTVWECDFSGLVYGVEQFNSSPYKVGIVGADVILFGGFQFLVSHHFHQHLQVHIVGGTITCVSVAEFVKFEINT